MVLFWHSGLAIIIFLRNSGVINMPNLFVDMEYHYIHGPLSKILFGGGVEALLPINPISIPPYIDEWVFNIHS
jgi:hypothetical protein